MARVLEAEGCNVVGTDLVDRGYGRGGVNFVAQRLPLAPIIITNPPYEKRLPSLFAEVASRMHIEEMWMLLKIDYFSAAGDFALYQRLRPHRIWQLTWRLDFLNLGSPMMNCMWVGWKRDFKGETKHGLLAKPKIENRDLFGNPDPAGRDINWAVNDDHDLFDAPAASASG
ncbi:hypothetical protein TH47_05785 [Thalassospira sp. MCCC 1A02803]|nr:hypothetical protein AUQ41_08550 [Thalassospira sp. MCCC 1A02898]ONH85354.1 hypothetical protein TH47_05785 [Thalassospira sp. MCCC 1A02803]